MEARRRQVHPRQQEALQSHRSGPELLVRVDAAELVEQETAAGANDTWPAATAWQPGGRWGPAGEPVGR